MFNPRMPANPGAPGTATAQEKILAVAAGLGVEGMDIMQGTTRTIYDSLPMTAGALVFNFFDGCNARAFPNTNLSNNRLEVGEAMAVEYLTLQTMTQAVVGTVTAVGVLGAVATSYYASDISLAIANQVVLKPTSIGQLYALFNKDSKFATNENFRFSSILTIPPLQPFVLTWRQTDATARANTYVKATLEGFGVIYRPKRGL